MTLATLCFDFETKSGYNELMIRLMMDSMVNTCIQDGVTVLGTDQNVVNHVARIGAVTISKPSTLVLGFVLVPSVSDEELVSGTEIQQSLPVFIDLTHPMRAKDGMPGVGVSSHASIEISQDNNHVSRRNGSQYRMQVIVKILRWLIGFRC